jgi:hypothetical protein
MIKKTLASITLALMGMAANAGVMLTIPNDAGGYMSLTDDTSTRCKQLSRETNILHSYLDSVSGTGVVLHKGCWTYDETMKMVTIKWASGGEVRYPLSRFTSTPYLYENDDAPAKPARNTQRGAREWSNL